MLAIYTAIAEKLNEIRDEEFSMAVGGNPRQPHEVVEHVMYALAELIQNAGMSYFDFREFIDKCKYVEAPMYRPDLDDS